ncbi:hypothetical protein H6P81_011178 [Aristolochia fimbriata]|uniref:non-specific serine/threonine protein kinase n=1 Tax=Aristolochia fimbriata TaxID=158543 RepID=A0AAV7ER38_ARIFI|nr:hypothetical protein H6P81_011178 [Aristolochia fimbriata]
MNFSDRISNQATIYYSQGRYNRQQSNKLSRSPKRQKQSKESTKEWVARAFYSNPTRPGRSSSSVADLKPLVSPVRDVKPPVAAATVNDNANTSAGDSGKKNTYHGKPAIYFERSHIDSQSENFKFCLIGKFPGWRPSLSQIRNWVATKWKLKGEWSITLLDHRHVLIRLDNEGDMLHVWPRNRCFIGGQLMRVFKWFPTFVPGSGEPSLYGCMGFSPFPSLGIFRRRDSVAHCFFGREGLGRGRSNERSLPNRPRQSLCGGRSLEGPSSADDNGSEQPIRQAASHSSLKNVKGKQIVESRAESTSDDSSTRLPFGDSGKERQTDATLPRGEWSYTTKIDQTSSAEYAKGVVNQGIDVTGKERGSSAQAVIQRSPQRRNKFTSKMLNIIWRSKQRGGDLKSSTQPILRLDSVNTMSLILLTKFKYSEIVGMTHGFRDVLGKGGFGTVYRGMLPDGQEVAVKVMSQASYQGEKEFLQEIQILKNTRHANIIRLLGCCSEGSNRILVSEFMRRGSLIGIIHVDERISTSAEKNTHFYSDTTLVRGTPGYLAPEFYVSNKVSRSADVYSYGITLLQMATGRKAVTRDEISGDTESILHWVRKRVTATGEIQGFTMDETQKKMIMVGLWCTQLDPDLRPSFRRVIQMLEGSIDELPPLGVGTC